jgi:putative CocE/NonD family hydrolase
MVGASLLGGSQWAVANQSNYPAALKAIAPDSPGINYKTYSTLWYPGGMLPGAMRVGRPGQEFGNNFPAHRNYDAFWDDLQTSTNQLRSAASRGLALLLTGGWYEYNSPGNLDGYAAYTSLSGIANKRLVVAPSGHTMPNWLYRALAIDWMARWLKGERNRAEQPLVLLYIRGVDRWRAEQTWPIADAKTVTLFLSPIKSGTIASRNDGSLLAVVAGNNPPAKFSYDPVSGPFLQVMVGAVGPPARGGGPPLAQGPEALGANPPHPFAANMAPGDQETVTWTSMALNTAMEITGNPVLKFWATSSIDDADFVASLTDVAPDGGAKFIIQGYLNGPREAYTRADPIIAPPTPLVPGIAREFRLRMLPTTYVVPAGHRIRIAIAGGADVAPGQGQAQGPGKNGSAFEVAILQSAGKVPILELPVIGTPATALGTISVSK